MDLAIPTQPQYSFYPHPYLSQPTLYISGLPPHVQEADLAPALQYCIPYRPKLNKDGSGTGTLEFKTMETAEKALATLSGRALTYLPGQVVLNLSPFPPSYPPTVLPPPSAIPRLVKQLPPELTDSDLFDIFRTYGALASVRRGGSFGPDTGIVEYWNEEDARRGEEAVHCAEIGGTTVTVQQYNPRRASGGLREFSPNVNAPTFVPRSAGSSVPQSPTSPQAYPYLSPRAAPMGFEQPVFSHGPGQQVQRAPPSGPGSGSASGLIDPCNLFVKNLDPDVNSHTLFEHFKQFGHIVSARVMRTETGQSKGFGFVSFQTPEQAALALRTMDGITISSKQIIVRLHEPKALRQEKLRERFAGGRKSNRGSGGTSPTATEGRGSDGESGSVDAPRQRRGSGSYYTAALAGNIVLRYDELSSLSPVVRREVLTGEFSRRLRELETQLETPVPEDEASDIIEKLVELPLDTVVEALRDMAVLEDLVRKVSPKRANSDELHEEVREAETASPVPEQTDKPTESSRTEPERPAPTPEQGVPLGLSASAPEHPSTPLSVPDQALKAHTPGPSSTVQQTEREKLQDKVAELEPKYVQEIADLLMSLSKKERALCLFSNEYLKTKVHSAKELVLLNAEEGDDDTTDSAAENGLVLTPSVSKIIDDTSPLGTREGTPQSASVASTATLSTATPPPYTLESLASLSASEIISIIRNPHSTGLPLPKADPEVVKETDRWMDEVQTKGEYERKQKLGEKLHKVVRGFGLKNTSKLIIQLLDQEDHRSLAHLMNSYPAVLREKVVIAGNAK